MSTVQDFEVHAVGTGRQLAELNDQVQELAAALENLLPVINEIDRIDPIDRAMLALDKVGRKAKPVACFTRGY